MAKKRTAGKDVKPKRTFRFRKVVLGFAIGIIYLLFVIYGIRTFYVEPRYEKFCDTMNYYASPYPVTDKPILTCEQKLNATAPSCDLGYLNRRYNATLGCEEAYCDTCRLNFEKADEKYKSDVFIIAVIAGAAALVAGVILGVEAVGSGLMFGGVLTIFFGVVMNWGRLGNIIKFLILGAVLVALIYIGYRKLKDD